MSVSFTTYSMRSNTMLDVDIYDWCVFVEGEKSTLDRIANVRYKLHPTFPIQYVQPMIDSPSGSLTPRMVAAGPLSEIFVEISLLTNIVRTI